MKDETPFGRRLRTARERAGLSQEALGALIGLDESTASARMSQYETGKHMPAYKIACAIALALDVPVEYLFSNVDRTADMLLLWHGMSAEEKEGWLKVLEARNTQADLAAGKD